MGYNVCGDIQLSWQISTDCSVGLCAFMHFFVASIEAHSRIMINFKSCYKYGVSKSAEQFGSCDWKDEGLLHLFSLFN